MELAGLLATVAFRQRSGRHHDQDERHSCHKETESNVAGRFDTCFAAWESTWVHAFNRSITEDKREVTEMMLDGTI